LCKASRKAICRELKLARKVVRKVIRSDAIEFRYEREAQPLPKIGPWKDELDRPLSANEEKPSRERLTLIDPAQLAGDHNGCVYRELRPY